MEIVAIMGSHRTGKNTQKAMDFFLNEIKGNHQTKVYNVNKINVKHCLGCDYCLAHQGECVIKDDDMAKIYTDLETSDLLVIASPVYFSAFPSRLKMLVDRTQVLYNLKDTSIMKEKKLVVIGLGGAPHYPKQYQGVENTLEWYKKYLNCDEIGFVTFNHTDEVEALENEKSLEELIDLAHKINALWA
ncbi:MAG: flavodoxin family protein [Eubacteriaceae bacterium]